MPDEPYNLIRERWMPVRDEDGNVWDMAPWEVTVPGPDGKLPVDLAAPRPDFDGALIQFLIGLVQTAFAPKTERAWRLKFKNPPEPNDLKVAFERYDHAFNLDGDGPRFMQDYEYAHGRIADGPKQEKISKLLIDAAADVTRYFNKSLAESQLGASSVAAVLFTFQINDPGVGRGHRMTLRGGGPLTTLVLGKTLWQTVWLNVLSRRDFETSGASQEHDDESDIFPWMAPTRTSGEEQVTTNDDVHPLQMYWPMPSRILIEPGEPSADLRRNLSETWSDIVFRHVKKRHHGTNYSGSWSHPLTPYAFNKEGTATWAVRGQPEGLSYRDWLGATIIQNDRRVYPAKVIRMAYRRTSYSVVEKTLGRRPRIWAFGYGMDSAKARTWQDSTMPLFIVSAEVRVAFEDFAVQLVSTADYLAGKLKTALKRGLYGKHKKGDKWGFPSHIKSDAKQKSILDAATTRFWRDTELPFFDYLEEAQGVLEENGPEGDSTLVLRRKWLEDLRTHLLNLYDEVTDSSTFSGADPKSVALARRDLLGAAGTSNKKTREKLGLPKNQTS